MKTAIPSNKRAQLIEEAYARTEVGGSACVRPEDSRSLEDFQEAFAAAEEYESAGFIEILESEDHDLTKESLIHPIRFRRLR